MRSTSSVWTRHDAEFEILEEPRPGLFGRIRGEARVRARVRPTQPRPKAERRDRRRRDEGAKDDAAAADVNAETVTATIEPSTATESGRGRGARSGRGSAAAAGGRKARTVDDSASNHPSTPVPRVQPHEEITMTDGEQRPCRGGGGRDGLLEGLLEAFGLDGAVAVREPAEGELEAMIEGDDLGLLVGPKGQTLLAIQDLTRLVAQRHLGPGSPRLAVDVAGYRQRRVEALRRFSLQLAEQVSETGAPKALEPMTAADRKVVHDSLTDVDRRLHGVRGRGALPTRGDRARLRQLTANMLVDRSCPPVADGVLSALAEAQQMGFLGGRSIGAVVVHARGFLGPIAHVERVVDLGSGAGVPGLIIAADRPDTEVVLLDASARRTDWLRRVVRRLGWDDRVTVVTGRAEVVARDPVWRERQPAVVARSFAAPLATAECAAGLLALGGTLVVSEPPSADPARWPAEALAHLGLDRRAWPDPAYAVLRKHARCPQAVPRTRMVRRG